MEGFSTALTTEVSSMSIRPVHSTHHLAVILSKYALLLSALQAQVESACFSMG